MIYDIHCHMPGIEYERNGNYVSPKLLKSPLYRYFRWFFGFGFRSAIEPGIDDLVRDKTLEWINESQIDKVVLLAFDGVYRSNGEIDMDNTHMMTANDYVAEIAAENEKALFGASVNPMRKDALDELDKAAGRGAVLVKWLPVGQNINPSDAAFIPFYQRLVELGIPLLCHTGTERAMPAFDHSLESPEKLRLPLDEGVTVIAAHCGTKSFSFDKCYYQIWRGMIDEYENLYGDISAFGLSGRVGVSRRAARDAAAAKRLLYGSDVPVTSFPILHALNIGPVKALKLQMNPNPFDRLYLTMRAVGMPDAVFTRAGGILRMPRR